MSMGHAMLTPVDTKTAPVIKSMAAPVIEYIAPSVAASYPSFCPSFDQIHEAVTNSENPQFSITADEISQISVGRIHEQGAVPDLVNSVESSPVVDSVPLLHAVEYIMLESRVPAPQIQEQVIVPEIPRARVVKRIRGKRAHQRTVEQNVRAPVPVQEQSFVPEKPGAQGEEQMPKSLVCRALADLRASELEEEEAYWNEYVDQMGPEQMHQERKSSKKKKKKNLDRTLQVMERIPEHTVVSFDQEEKLNNIKV